MKTPSSLAMLGLATFNLSAATLHVSLESMNPVSPYATWATAATSIQDAVDAASAGDTVLVTNGVYAVGSREVSVLDTNLEPPQLVSRGLSRVAVTNAISLESVNGPLVTLIEGAVAVRGVYVGSNAALNGFTVTAGHASLGGGVLGASTGTITNCIITGNSADRGGGVSGGRVYGSSVANNSATNRGGGVFDSLLHRCTLNGNQTTSPIGAMGGGAYQSTLYDCLVTSNSASVRIGLGGSGGGAASSTLYQCVLVANSARHGGGISGATLYNCTVVGNGAEYGGGTQFGTLYNSVVYYNSGGNNYVSSFTHCCTTDIQSDDGGNMSLEPALVDFTAGNLRLQSNSPCINAGLNAYSPMATDFEGNPRIVSGTVDIGAYEFQGDGSTISYAWLQHYALPTDGSADATDLDGDGQNLWQEWRCQTNPSNALSALRLLTTSPDGTNATVSWQSVAGVNYFLERSTNLWASPPFAPLATGILGQPGTTSFMDTNAVGMGPFLYRVGVRP